VPELTENVIIKEFTGDYAFLSNFYPSPLVFDDITFPTVEHYFQASKSNDPAEHAKIAALPTPGKAKRAGRLLSLRPNWDSFRILVMITALKIKFAAGTELAEKLLATGNAYLQEGNRHGDVFWGVDLDTNNGKNKLGELLMKQRYQLRVDQESLKSL
jgi:N-glycosidase YbiA